jgi:lambda repressor-like predicted transcriptional regulator
MHYADIIAALTKRGWNLTRIAEAEGVNVSSVSRVVRGTGRSISVARRIARIIGVPVNTLWPDAYGKPRPRYRDRIDRQAA